MQTTVLISPEVLEDPDTAATVTEELPVVIDYIHRHGLIGDGLALDPQAGPRRATGAHEDLETLAAAPPPAAGDPQQLIDATLERHQPYSDDDQALFVITASPDRWQHALPVDRGDPHGPSDRDPASTSRLITPADGSDSVRNRRILSFDPTQRGELAEVVASTWVEAYGGRYPDAPAGR